MRYRLQIGRFALYVLTIVCFFFSPILASAINIGLLNLISTITPITGGPIIGGFTEPFTTKLLPAIFVVYVIQNISDTDLPNSSYAPSLAIVAGISMAWGEAYFVKLPQYPTSEDPTILIAAVLGTTVLHTVNSILVAGTYFLTANTATPRRSDILRTLPWICTAIGIHVVWNGYLSNQDWFLPFWYDLLRAMVI